MKSKLIILTISIAIFSCNTQIKKRSDYSNKVAATKQSFDWLLGKWKRLNEKDNKKTFEHWEKKTDNEYIGFGFTMQNKDTIWQENMKLLNNTGYWSFDVVQKGEMEPTKFKLIEMEDGKFTCENQANEFPKIIAYASKGDTLHAKISGGDREIFFDFLKEK